jgi:type II secretory pathway pseudopilin PulG
VRKQADAFSLVEVVIAIGVIAFAIIAILGVLPVGLTTGHSAQDETRAPQIAQDILNSIASQAQTHYKGSGNWTVTVVQPPTFSYDINLGQAFIQKWLSADYDGTLVTLDPQNPADVFRHPYQIRVIVSPDPAGFDVGYASQVTVEIRTPPSANPDQTPRTDQTVRNYVRVVTHY